MKLFIKQESVRKAGAVERRSVHLVRQKTRGEMRGGSFVARVVTGTDKDGSPQYRYFKTNEEYKSYLDSKGSGKKESEAGKKKGEALSGKTSKESKKTRPAAGGIGSRSLFVPRKDKQTRKSLETGLYLENKE
tara:strand:- start:15170 stop:15568 length:399 start_codon:yes stop_codon:yes gene_type:complete